MIRFIQQVYLTGFVIIFRLARVKDIAYKAGGAIGVIALVEGFALEGLRGYAETYLKTNHHFSRSQVFAAFFALFLVNGYFLFFRRHGIKFNQEFDSLSKSRRIVLVVSWVVLSVAAIVFGICSAIAHRHFIGAD